MKWSAFIPTTGVLYVPGIEANTKQEAIEAALAQLSEKGCDGIDHTWEFMEHTSEGNVSHALQTHADAEKEKDL